MNNAYEYCVNSVQSQLNRLIPQWKSKRFLLAVSGGADSVLLLHVFKTLNCKVEIAHVNYNLRGKDSVADENFVRQLALKYHVKFHSHSVDAKALKKNRQSIQMLAREIRYEFFDKIMNESGINYLALAHHANDQVETVFMNMLRGTGLEGISGMKVLNGKKFRPLLDLKKSQILAAIKNEKLKFREDKSNSETKYQRNKLRLKLFPSIEKEFPDFIDTMLSNIGHWNELRNELVEDLPSFKIKFNENDKWSLIDVNSDAKKNYHFVNSCIHNGFKTSELTNFLKNSTSKSIRIHSSIGYLEKKGNSIVFYDNVEQDKLLKVVRAKNKLSISGLESIGLKSCNEKIDIKSISGELICRKWISGDKMIPLGMKGFKKVSDLLTDLKLSKTQKSLVHLLCDDEKIVWVIGYRIDNRVRLSGREKPTEILNLIVK